MHPVQSTISGLGLAGVVGPPSMEVANNKKSRRRLAPAAVLAEVVLTLGAILGVVVAATTVTAAHHGLRPLVVRSGSMEPTITTGAMVLVKKVEAPAIRVGDVVTVERPDHTRVTHRVLAVEHRGTLAELTMKGDANEDPDPFPVTVTHAYRLAWQVPVVGRTVAWLATAQGGFVIGCLATAFVLRGARRGKGGLRRSRGNQVVVRHS